MPPLQKIPQQNALQRKVSPIQARPTKPMKPQQMQMNALAQMLKK